MIDVYFSTNDEHYVWASDLHKGLQIKSRLSNWMPRMIAWGFEENKDFIRRSKFVPSAGTIEKALFDWAMTLDMAKHIAMIQKTTIGKEIRNYLLGLDKKVSEGEFLNQAQIMALFDICKVMGYFSVQVFFEKEHYEKIFNKSGINWWEERARLFGYTAKELQDGLKELGIKYKNKKQAVYNLDKHDLIRWGVIDLFVCMGKSKAYAKNVGNIAKEIAKQINPEIYNDIDTAIDFKSEEQKLIITDLKNYENNNSNILKKFSKHDKNTPNINSTYNQLNIGLNDTK